MTEMSSRELLCIVWVMGDHFLASIAGCERHVMIGLSYIPIISKRTWLSAPEPVVQKRIAFYESETLFFFCCCQWPKLHRSHSAQLVRYVMGISSLLHSFIHHMYCQLMSLIVSGCRGRASEE